MSSRGSQLLDVTFIIPCFRNRETIGRTLQCISAQETDASFEVIVIDSSQDSTSEWLRQNFPLTEVISSSIRLSPGAARNLGVSRAKGRFLAFLDADTTPSPDWLETLLARIQKTPEIDVIGAAVEIDNPGTLSARILHWIEFSEFLKSGLPRFKSHLSSSNLLIERNRFLEAGGFDESFAMAEDLLLSRSFSGKLFFESTTGVGHFYRSQWSEVVSHLRRLGFWSGRLRGKVDTRGSWLKRSPALSFALPHYRCLLVLSRLWQKSARTGLWGCLHSPLILLALFYWASGFWRGIRESGEDSSKRGER